MNKDKMYFPEKWYLRFKGNTSGFGSNMPGLAYVRPYEEDDDLSDSKFDSVDDWSGDVAGPFVCTNDPSSCHEMVNYTSRHRSDNKVFRIRDGDKNFVLEIYAHNVVHLFKNAHIEGRHHPK